jgi:acyl-CoA thioesterase-1
MIEMPFRALVVIFLLAGPLFGAAAQTWFVGRAQAAALPAPPGACQAPEDLLSTTASFANIAADLAPGRDLDILAIDSATMLAPNQSTEASFPYRMAAYLRDREPGGNVNLTVRSGRGMTAVNMLAQIRTELAAHRYQLVIWQTGTVEAVRNLPPADFLDTLTEGVDAVRRQHGEVVLIDPQYSRFLRANANLDPYLAVMREAGTLPNAALFRRYDITKFWVDAGQIDLEKAERAQRQNVADQLHECIGRSLASLLVQAAGLPSP